ncbi:hypothetical protein COOONC_05034, partial [Cooperia oncophora]
LVYRTRKGESNDTRFQRASYRRASVLDRDVFLWLNLRSEQIVFTTGEEEEYRKRREREMCQTEQKRWRCDKGMTGHSVGAIADQLQDIIYRQYRIQLASSGTEVSRQPPSGLDGDHNGAFA